MTTQSSWGGNQIREIVKKLPLAPLIIDIGRHIQAPGRQQQVWRDYLKTYSEVAFFRKMPAAPSNGKTLLIASMSDFIYQTKLEAFLAMALKARGWNVKVLNSRFHTWARKYFRADVPGKCTDDTGSRLKMTLVRIGGPEGG